MLNEVHGRLIFDEFMSNPFEIVTRAMVENLIYHIHTKPLYMMELKLIGKLSED